MRIPYRLIFFCRFFGRIFKINPLRINFQIHLGGGGPTTLGSDNNSFRKGLTEALVGASGVPRLVSKTPIFGESTISYLFTDDLNNGWLPINPCFLFLIDR